MRVFQRAWDEKPTAQADRLWKFEEVDLAAVAAQFGCAAFRVESPGDIEPAFKEALQAGRPALIDVVTETEALPERPHGGRDFYANS
jgi:acetolactate synthase I/II/III large subunit